MTTKLKLAAEKAIRKACKAMNIEVQRVRHVYPRCYVIGRTAPMCLIVARPWQDAEPQCREFDRENPLQTVRIFDAALKAGDWCATAYIVTASASETVAVRMEE